MKKTIFKPDSAFYDFKKSAVTSAIPCVFAATALILSSCLISLNEYLSRGNQLGLCFFTKESFLASLVFLLLISTGVWTAYAQFSFLGSVSQANVLMSFGISRDRLFRNRIRSGALNMFLSVFLPFTATLLINVSYNGVNERLIKVYLLYLISAYTAMLIGFSAGTLAATLTGARTSAAALYAALVLIPSFILIYTGGCMSFFLRGYGEMIGLIPDACWEFSYLNPVSLLVTPDNPTSYNGYGNLWSDFAVHSSISAAPDAKLADFLPFAAWLVVCALIIIGARRLFILRKAEKCGQTKTKPFAVIMTVLSVLCAACFSIELLGLQSVLSGLPFMPYDYPDSGYYVVLLLPAAGALLVCLRVFGGKLRKHPSRLIYMPLILLLLAPPALCLSGGFGYVTRVPDPSSVEYITFQSGYLPNFDNLYSEAGMYCFDSEKDKALVASLHKTLVTESGKKEYGVNDELIWFHYTLKDGGTFSRIYYACTGETRRALTALFDSVAVETYLYKQFGDKSSWFTDEDWAALPEEKDFLVPYSLYPRDIAWLRFGNQTVTLHSQNSSEITDITDRLTEETFDRLLNCIAFDLVSMSAKEFYYPDTPPAYVLTLTEHKDPESWGEPPAHPFFIAASMKKTTAYLNTLGFSGMLNKKSDIVEIKTYGFRHNKLFVQDAAARDGIISVNGFINGSLGTVTDQNAIEAMAAKMFPVYLPSEQPLQGAVAVYADGSRATFVLKN